MTVSDQAHEAKERARADAEKYKIEQLAEANAVSMAVLSTCKIITIKLCASVGNFMSASQR